MPVQWYFITHPNAEAGIFWIASYVKQCRYNVAQYNIHDITHSTATVDDDVNQNFYSQKDTLSLALMGEIWRICREDFAENWRQRYFDCIMAADTLWGISVKDPLSRYKDLRYKDETAVRLSYIYIGNSYPGKTTSLYWNDPGYLRCHQQRCWINTSLSSVMTDIDTHRIGQYLACWCLGSFTLWGRNKMDVISQTTFSNAFS